MAKLMILLDYRNDFWISIENLQDYTSMKVRRIYELFEQYGHTVEIYKFSELDLSRDYKDYYILYQTSEDPGVFYQNYIKDIIYFLECKGATMLPKYAYLLAHNNKNFMELLRLNFTDDGLKTIKSHQYGTAEEAIAKTNEFPVIIKSAEGSGSSGVFLASDRSKFEKLSKRISSIFIGNDFKSLQDFIIWRFFLKLAKKVKPQYKPHTFYRRKFIVQNFIKDLKGDYKVLYFDGRYYPIYRKNRDNDFRASGSGKIFPVDDHEIPDLLNFAQKIIKEADFPIIGMDIGFDGTTYHLFEFQFIHIGPYALQCAQQWYEFDHGTWIKKLGSSNLEEEFCRAIDHYIRVKEKISA